MQSSMAGRISAIGTRWAAAMSYGSVGPWAWICWIATWRRVHTWTPSSPGSRGLEERGSGLRQSGPEDPHHLALELLLGGPLIGDGEGGSDVGGPGTGQPAHRHLLEEQRHDERDHGHRDRRREHVLERVGVRRDDRVVLKRRKGLHRGRAGHLGRVGAGRSDRLGEVRRELVGVDGAEDRCAERAAHRPEERDAGGGNAQVAILHGVLHDDRQHLHGQADPDPEHEHRARRLEGRGVLVEVREPPHADRHHDRPDDREDPVPAGAADDVAGAHRRDDQPEHHRQRAQPGDGGADALAVLQVRRQEGHAAQQREADDEAEHGADAEHVPPEQSQREDRLGRPAARPRRSSPGRPRPRRPGR